MNRRRNRSARVQPRFTVRLAGTTQVLTTYTITNEDEAQEKAKKLANAWRKPVEVVDASTGTVTILDPDPAILGTPWFTREQARGYILNSVCDVTPDTLEKMITHMQATGDCVWHTLYLVCEHKQCWCSKCKPEIRRFV